MIVRSRRAALLAVAGIRVCARRCRVRRLATAAAEAAARAKPTQAQEASATKQIDINEQPLDKRQAGRHGPLGGRPVLDAVELQPAQRPRGVDVAGAVRR